MLMTFGEYIKQTRTGRGLSLYDVSSKLDISVPYLSEMENGSRRAPDLVTLKRLSEALMMSPAERDTLYDLAGKSRGTIAPDLIRYIADNPYVSTAIRLARDIGVDRTVWNEFIEDLK